MRFAAVARVTEDRWIACSVLDKIDFGLEPGAELKAETTICREIRRNHEPVIIAHVDTDEVWCQHPIPAFYGFQSFISMPIILADGSVFGTLCALDPRPAPIDTPEVVGMFRLFAELIAKHLETARRFSINQSELTQERTDAELREHFIAVLGHDLRAPVRAVSCYAELVLQTPLIEEAVRMVHIMKDSAARMNDLIETLLDLARGHFGGGLPLAVESHLLEPILREVMTELEADYPDQIVQTLFDLDLPVRCDAGRIAQLYSNLLSNALNYGDRGWPIRVSASSREDGFKLSIANAGKPIPPEAIPHLFKPFYRNTIQHSDAGLGLGLYIASEIANAHGGTLEVLSGPAETRFTFHLPVMALS